jgi:recombination protein RecT
MARICTTALRTTPKLAESDPVSFIGCVLSLAQVGLEPNTPLQHAWLIPRNNKRRGGIETTILIGYQGFAELARRSGMVLGLYSHVVFQGDHFRWSLGTEPKIEHEPVAPGRSDPKQVTHAYAVARIRDAEPMFEVLTLEQIAERRRRSMAKSDGPWVTDTIAMMRKTAIRAIWPQLPKSVEMQNASAMDDAGERGLHVASTVAEGSIAAEVLDRLGAPREDFVDVDPATGEVNPDSEPTDEELARAREARTS